MKNAINLDNSFHLLSTKPTSAIELRNVIQMLTVIINRFDSRGSEIVEGDCHWRLIINFIVP